MNTIDRLQAPKTAFLVASQACLLIGQIVSRNNWFFIPFDVLDCRRDLMKESTCVLSSELRKVQAIELKESVCEIVQHIIDEKVSARGTESILSHIYNSVAYPLWQITA